MTDRASLRQLIEALPESQLEAAEYVLTHLQERPETEATETLRKLAVKPTPYDEDFYQWTRTQAAALRDNELKELAKALKPLAALDLANLAEEIESLGKRDRRAVESYLEVVMMHLLKWVYQPQERARRGLSWRRSIDNARGRLEKLARDNPSLRELPPALVEHAYHRARRGAARDTGLPLTTFAAICPWNLEQLQDEDFLPEE